MKFLHAADLHLDSPLQGLSRYEGAPVEAVRQASRRALVNLIDLAIAEEVDLVLLAGDCFDDDWKDYRTGLFFHRQLVRLREARIDLIMIRGNHDAASVISRELQWPDNVTLFSSSQAESLVREELGLAIHGRSYPRREVTEDLVGGYPPPVPGLVNIGILHTALTGYPGHEPYAPCRLEGLLHRGYHYWALGHIHQRQILHEDPWVVFPGNIQGRHIRESGEKGCLLVTTTGERVASAHFHPLDVGRWQVVPVIMGETDPPDALLEQVAMALPETSDNSHWWAVRVRISGRGRGMRRLLTDPEKWRNELRALMNDRGQGKVWLEKLEWSVESPAELAKDLAESKMFGAEAAIQAAIGEALEDDKILAELASKFQPLAQKLPAEIREGVEGINPTDPAVIRHILQEMAMGDPMAASGEDP